MNDLATPLENLGLPGESPQWLGLLDLPTLACELRRLAATGSAERCPILHERASRVAARVALHVAEGERCPPGAERRRLLLLAREGTLETAELLEQMRVGGGFDPSLRPTLQAIVRRLGQLLARLAAPPREPLPVPRGSREPTQPFRTQRPSGTHKVVREPSGIHRIVPVDE